MTPFAKQNGKTDGKTELTERQIVVLKRISERPSELAEEMAKALDISRRTLDRETAILRKLNYIKRKDNNSPWIILKECDE